MRVTNNMMVNTLNHNLSKNLNRMTISQEHLASGKRIHRASDDPIDASKVLKYYTDLSELDQYDLNTRDALNWMEVTESSISDSGEVIQRARELAVQAANGVNTTSDRQKIAQEIKNLKDHLIMNGNFSFAGKYVFSGFQTNKPLFNSDGTYNINITDGDIAQPARNTLLIGPGESIQVTTNGIDVFGVVDVPNAFSSMYTDTAGDTMSLNKSALKGNFNLSGVHSTDNLDVTISGVTYDVDEVLFDGTTALPLTQDAVIARYREALAGGVGPGRLLDVADVYFDDNANLVIEAKNPGNIPMSTVSTTYKTSKLYTGDIAEKSELKGSFQLSGPNADYTVRNLDVTVGGLTYQVDESSLNGFSFNMTKEMVTKQFREALVGGVGPATLADVADVYFNALDELVIKEKNFGANPITIAAPGPGFTPTLQVGQNTTEATLEFNNFTFNDAFISANEAELKNTPVFITLNGIRQELKLDSAVILNTTAQYQAALQDAADQKFGLGNVVVGLGGAAPNEHLTFSSNATVAGQPPQMRVEFVKTRTSSIIKDFDDFITGLNAGDNAAIRSFLLNIDTHLNRALSVRAEIGAKVNRLELVRNRIGSNQISFTKMLSETEDVDMAETIMTLQNSENVYRASLSTGARIIQPSLIDFLR